MIPYIMVAIIGITIGSFLNVCIYRIPNGESIAFPGSHCGNCNQDLKALDLVPILSYLILKGQCRYCKQKISLQYPLIELTNGILYLLIYYYFGLSIMAVAYAILFSLLLTITIIDYGTMRIPNPLIIFGLTVGIIYLIILTVVSKDIRILRNGVLGMLAGVSIIGAIMLFSLLIFKKEGMGMGDLKLLGMIGLFTGTQYTLYTIFIAVILGGIYGAIVMLKKKQQIFPFGPFLSLGAMIAILWGDELWHLYMNYML